MNCPKQAALVAVEVALAEAIHLQKMLETGDCNGLFDNLMIAHNYIKESVCPGGAHTTGR